LSKNNKRKLGNASDNRSAHGNLPSGLIREKAPTDQGGRNPKDEHKTFFNQLGNDLKKPRFWIEIAALFVVGLYTRQAYVANTLTKKSLDDIQRAFVTVTNVSTTHEMQPGEKVTGLGDADVPTLSVDIEQANSGNTPARHARIKASVCLHNSFSLPENFSFPENSQFGSQYTLTAKAQVPTYIPIDPVSFDRALTGKQRLFIYGAIQYIDIFKQLRTSEFCFFLAGTKINVKTGERETAWQGCAAHNCEDEDCPDQWGSDASDCPSPVFKPAKPPPTPQPVRPVTRQRSSRIARSVSRFG
jgi:hypothetical protein